MELKSDSFRNLSVVLFIVLSLFTSCKKKDKEYEKGKEYIDTISFNESKFEYIKAPSVVKRNKFIYGDIKYDTNIDTIDKLDINDRLILFFISKSTSNTDIDDIKNKQIISYLDTIGSGLYKFKFKLDTIGFIKLKIAVVDMLSLNISKDSVREIIDESIVTYRLEVKE